MSKETMKAEVKEAIAKAQEFLAETEETEKVSETVEPMNKPETGKQKQKPGQKKQEPKKTESGKKSGKAEVATKEDKKAQLALSREFNRRSGIIEKNLASIENSFLTIAFNLHWIKRNNMHKQAGYKNIYEYAECVHGIGRTSCSNLICIVENFAERDEKGEVVEKIAECYRKFKQSQLVAMMGLSPDQIAKIDENTSVREISRMKQEKEVVQDDGSDGDDGNDGGEKDPGKVKVSVERETLASFRNFNEYMSNLEESEKAMEKAFRKYEGNVIIQLVCIRDACVK